MPALAGVESAPAGAPRGRGPLSYSSFHTYEECPQRWKYLYIEQRTEAPRPYFSFGRSMHLALETLVTPLVGGQRPRKKGQTALTDFLAEEDALWMPDPSSPPLDPTAVMSVEELLGNYERLWVKEGFASPDEERRYFETGRDLLRRYHGLFAAAPPRPVAVEKRLVGDMEGIPIHGILDRIDLRPGGALEVIDYKTSRELSVRDALTSDQLSFYQVLVESNYDYPVERLTLYHLRSLTPLSSPPREERQLSHLAGRVSVVAEGISSQRYEPRVSPQCNRCEFRSLCPAFAGAGPVPRKRR